MMVYIFSNFQRSIFYTGMEAMLQNEREYYFYAIYDGEIVDSPIHKRVLQRFLYMPELI